MPMRAWTWLLLALTVYGACSCIPSRAAAPAGLRGKQLARMLETTTPEGERRHLFELEQAAAMGGNSGAQYLVGSLYHAGHTVRAGFVQRDLAEAAVLLSNAAIHGHIWAMAKMAEIEHVRGHAMSAVIWAQTFGFYSGTMKASASDRRREGYLADLLYRVQTGFDKKQLSTVSASVNRFIHTYDTQIHAGRKPRPGTASLLYPTKMQRFKSPRPDVSQFIAGPGVCDFFLIFDATGHVTHAWLFDATPRPRTCRNMHAYAMHIRANRLKSGRLPRYGAALIVAATNRHRLR